MRIGSFLMGGLVGAGLAMLLTPRSGEETKAQLKEKAQGLQGRTSDLVEQGRLRATELIKSGREMIDDRLQQGAQAVDTAIDRTRHTLEQQEPRAEEAVNRTAEDLKQRTRSNPQQG